MLVIYILPPFIIFVSHKMDEIFRVCDRVTVLQNGKYIGTDEHGQKIEDKANEKAVGLLSTGNQQKVVIAK